VCRTTASILSALKIREELSYVWQERGKVLSYALEEHFDSVGYVKLERAVRRKENRSD
jgi:hypothetical protein